MELLIFLSVFILLCLTLVKVARKSRPVKLPPGPRQLPIIGNMHQLIGSLPHRILADLAKRYGDLMHLQLGEISTVIVSSAEAAKEIMKDHDLVFAYRPDLLSARVLFYNSTDIGFSPYGDYWRQLRKICTLELLSSRRIQTFQSIRKEETSHMIRSISSQEGLAVNLSAMVSSLAFSIIAQAAYGKRSKYHNEFMSAIEDVIKLMGGFSIVDMYPSIKILEKITGMRHKLERVHEKVDRALEDILNEHRVNRAESNPGNGDEKEDLVDVLLSIQQSEEFGAPLTDNNIKAVIFDVFSAGGESSATTLMWSLAEMINNPGVLKRAQDEVREIYADSGNVDESQIYKLKYLQAVIKEVFRLHPAGPLLLPRECSEKCEIYEYEIPLKTKVIINAWAIMRDPKYWIEPQKFYPERFLDSEIDFRGQNFSYIPFGAGRRMCPGILFALTSIQLPLAQLLYHFDWKLPAGSKQEQLDMTETFGVAVRPKQDLVLIPIPYSRPSSM